MLKLRVKFFWIFEFLEIEFACNICDGGIERACYFSLGNIHPGYFVCGLALDRGFWIFRGKPRNGDPDCTPLLSVCPFLRAIISCPSRDVHALTPMLYGYVKSLL